MTVYYELVKHTISDTTNGELRIATAAAWACQLCGEVIDGQGNWAGYAKRIEIRLEDGTTQFSGVRGSFDKLADVLYNADDYIDTDVTVRYQNRTDEGKLRFPVIVAFWKGRRDI